MSNNYSVRAARLSSTNRKVHLYEIPEDTHSPKGAESGLASGLQDEAGGGNWEDTVRRHFLEVAATQHFEADCFKNVYVGILFTYIHVLKYMHGNIYIYIYTHTHTHRQFPAGSDGQESTCQCRRCEFYPWVGKIPLEREWQPTPVYSWASLVAQMIKNPPAMQETWV